LRQIGFLLIPASVVSAVLAEPIVRIVYERGAFTESDVTVVAGCLAAFSLGLVFNGWMLMLTRAFYGLQSNWIPTLVAVGTLVLNAVLDLVLYRVGIWGIPLATSLVNVVGVCALVFFLRSRVAGIDLARVMDTIVRVTLASIVLGAAAFGVWYALDGELGRSLVAQIASLGIALVVGGAAYVVASRSLGVTELRVLRETLSRNRG
jgi:putative peptidoglycan lipid II flippase